MTYANLKNNQISLESELTNLATYNDLIEELCLGNLGLPQFTMVKDGIVTWDENNCEMDFIEFLN